MKISFNIGDREFILNSYTSQQERDVHILQTVNESPSVSEIFLNFIDFIQPLNCSLNELSDNEKVAILYKLRSISVGEEVEVIYKCHSCSHPNETTINIVDNVNTPTSSIKGVVDNYKGSVNTFEEIQSLVDVNLEELDTEEYDEFVEELKKSVVTYNWDKPSLCMKCNKKTVININDSKFLVDNLSEDNVSSFYTNVSDIVNNGGYTKEDVMKMIPLERTIYIGLLNKWLEARNA